MATSRAVMELFGLGVCPVQVFSPVDNRSPVQICQEAVLPYLESGVYYQTFRKIGSAAKAISHTPSIRILLQFTSKQKGKRIKAPFGFFDS